MGKPTRATRSRTATMADDSTAPKPDPFVELSVEAASGLSNAIRELNWIADGGDPSAKPEDEDLANVKRVEYDRERNRINGRLLAFLRKELSVQPPSDDDIEAAKSITARLAKMRDVNVRATTVVKAATDLLDIYNRA
ncbi:hypothetical protein [Nitrospira sp. BLG_1]|uniref:hypothetical protein n=1 Tax=Nitrospira sp. BLG_1 TaxID=3395883 RepID=UPI0039BD5268